MNDGRTRAAAIVGYVSGALLILSAFAHALGGWPELEGLLSNPGADLDAVGAARVGWMFGSVSMLVFGAIVIGQARRAGRGGGVDRLVVGAIALGYVGFGVWAVLGRGKPHFLLFIASGLLVGTLLLARPSTAAV